MNLTVRPPVVMVRGEGSYLFDEAGRRYLDFVQGWAVNSLGHSPPELVAALSAQAARLVSAGPAYHTAPQAELAELLVRASGLSRAFFCSSGAEANEGAIKLARKWGKVNRGGAYEIVTTDGAFHGRTLATMAATGKPGWDTMFPPAMPGFVKVPFADSAAVARAIGPSTAAVLVEPIQGEAGVVVPPPGYLAELRALTRDRGVLLMFDEVQTGMGRTGKLFAFEHEAARPDVMTLGKGIGGGVPLAALLASEAAACFERGEQGGTYAGNPLAAAAGLAVFRALSAPGFLEAVARRGALLKSALETLGVASGIVEVRGQGLLVAARLASADAERVRDAAFDAGLLVNAPRPDVLRFMPSLRVTDDEIASMLELLEGVLRLR